VGKKPQDDTDLTDLSGRSFMTTAKSSFRQEDRLRRQPNCFSGWMIVCAGGEIIFPAGWPFMPTAKSVSHLDVRSR
jgi:hypothetical protein